MLKGGFPNVYTSQVQFSGKGTRPKGQGKWGKSPIFYDLRWGRLPKSWWSYKRCPLWSQGDLTPRQQTLTFGSVAATREFLVVVLQSLAEDVGLRRHVWRWVIRIREPCTAQTRATKLVRS